MITFLSNEYLRTGHLMQMNQSARFVKPVWKNEVYLMNERMRQESAAYLMNEHLKHTWKNEDLGNEHKRQWMTEHLMSEYPKHTWKNEMHLMVNEDERQRKAEHMMNDYLVGKNSHDFYTNF